MTTKFTPGPWTKAGSNLIKAGRRYIAEVYILPALPMSNVDLIAAAPEMYEALKEAVEEWRSDVDEGKDWVAWAMKAQAALAKADGGLQ